MHFNLLTQMETTGHAREAEAVVESESAQVYSSFPSPAREVTETMVAGAVAAEIQPPTGGMVALAAVVGVGRRHNQIFPDLAPTAAAAVMAAAADRVVADSWK